MKEIKVLDPIYLNSDISVKPYLTYAQIQAIVNQVCKFETWSERNEAIDIMLLHFATNLTDEEIKGVKHEDWIQSGIMDEIKSKIKNLHLIQEGVDYTQSVGKALLQIAKEMPELLEPLKGAVKNAHSKK